MNFRGQADGPGTVGIMRKWGRTRTQTSHPTRTSPGPPGTGRRSCRLSLIPFSPQGEEHCILVTGPHPHLLFLVSVMGRGLGGPT